MRSILQLKVLPSVVTPFVKHDRLIYEIAKELHELESIKSKLFPYHITFDPVWRMFLELLIAHYNNQPTSIASLSAASGVPNTTALRYIKILENDKFLQRRNDPNNGTRRYIYLTEKSAQLMESVLRRFIQK